MTQGQYADMTQSLVSTISQRKLLNVQLIILSAIICSFLGGSTYAQTPAWTFELTNPSQEVMPNSTMVFEGTITNATDADLLLDDFNVRLVTNTPDSDFTQHVADEFLHTLGVIPTSGYKGPIFVVNWLASTPVDTTATLTVTIVAEAVEPSSISQVVSIEERSSSRWPLWLLIVLVIIAILVIVIIIRMIPVR